MSKPLGQGLKNRMENMKEVTALKVKNAIEALLDEGVSKQKIRRKDLLERTGLSNGTLSQEHVKEVLREYGVCQFYQTAIVSKRDNEEKKQQFIDDLVIENKKLKSRLEDRDLEIKSFREKVKKKSNEKTELEEKLQLLRGKYQTALEVINIIKPEMLDRFSIE